MENEKHPYREPEIASSNVEYCCVCSIARVPSDIRTVELKPVCRFCIKIIGKRKIGNYIKNKHLKSVEFLDLATHFPVADLPQREPCLLSEKHLFEHSEAKASTSNLGSVMERESYPHRESENASSIYQNCSICHIPRMPSLILTVSNIPVCRFCVDLYGIHGLMNMIKSEQLKSVGIFDLSTRRETFPSASLSQHAPCLLREEQAFECNEASTSNLGNSGNELKDEYISGNTDDNLPSSSTQHKRSFKKPSKANVSLSPKETKSYLGSDHKNSPIDFSERDPSKQPENPVISICDSTTTYNTRAAARKRGNANINNEPYDYVKNFNVQLIIDRVVSQTLDADSSDVKTSVLEADPKSCEKNVTSDVERDVATEVIENESELSQTRDEEIERVTESSENESSRSSFNSPPLQSIGLKSNLLEKYFPGVSKSVIELNTQDEVLNVDESAISPPSLTDLQEGRSRAHSRIQPYKSTPGRKSLSPSFRIVSTPGRKSLSPSFRIVASPLKISSSPTQKKLTDNSPPLLSSTKDKPTKYASTSNLTGKANAQLLPKCSLLQVSPLVEPRSTRRNTKSLSPSVIPNQSLKSSIDQLTPRIKPYSPLKSSRRNTKSLSPNVIPNQSFEGSSGPTSSSSSPGDTNPDVICLQETPIRAKSSSTSSLTESPKARWLKRFHEETDKTPSPESK